MKIPELDFSGKPFDDENAVLSPIAVAFCPATNITAYELSQLLPYLLGQSMYEEDWEKLGAATKHLKRL